MIKLKDITKYYYGDSSVTLALKDVNLEFKKGEFVAITGKSGSGKSTLINLISGMDTYEEGEMYLKGMETSYFDEDDWELYRKNNISFVYQSYNLIDSYTALQNVETVMMICENDENRLTKKQRREKAMEVLKKVGLEKQAHNKASHMSSGQKQRLGIARALAKDTDIIVADEPTGNLDVENGKAIMAILHELSKENKLVLVVTHNYEQAEPYVTRKIRLFDGEVVEDLKLDEELYKDKDYQSDYLHEVAEEKEATKTFKTARQFVHMNRLAQPHRSFLIFAFILISSIATMIFLGNFISNIDDTSTREISNIAFSNTENDRILVKRLDGESIGETDIEKLSNLSHVVYAEYCDNANDCNYYIVEDEDYKKEYTVGTVTKKVTIKKLSNEKFVKSSAAISEEALKSGRLAENNREVVLYSEDEDVLGETVEIYISNVNWRESHVFGDEFTIVGILEEETEQVYFEKSFVEGYDTTIMFSELTFDYTIRETNDFYDETVEDKVVDKKKSVSCNIVIGEGLTGNQARIANEVILTLCRDGKELSTNISYKDLLTEGTIVKKIGEENEETYNIEFVEDGSMCNEGILEVSEELYYKILGENNMLQTSVFIEDYAYTDDVLETLYDNGYDAISVYRVSATDYISEKVTSRLVTLLVSILIILVIFVLDVLVIYLLMKLKKGDFLIMKSLGMKQKMANQMNYYELLTLTVLADIFAIAVGCICLKLELPLISDVVKYFRVKHYVALIIINGLMAITTGVFYNRYLSKRFRLTSVKND